MGGLLLGSMPAWLFYFVRGDRASGTLGSVGHVVGVGVDLSSERVGAFWTEVVLRLLGAYYWDPATPLRRAGLALELPAPFMSSSVSRSDSFCSCAVVAGSSRSPERGGWRCSCSPSPLGAAPCTSRASPTSSTTKSPVMFSPPTSRSSSSPVRSSRGCAGGPGRRASPFSPSCCSSRHGPTPASSGHSRPGCGLRRRPRPGRARISRALWPRDPPTRSTSTTPWLPRWRFRSIGPPFLP